MSVISDQEGKGKAGEDEIDDDEIFAKAQAKKKEKDEKLFPEKLGPHQTYVKHPSAIFPKWASFSKELKVKTYTKYLQYVENWNKGKKGSSMKKSNFHCTYVWTPEDQAEVDNCGNGKSQNTAFNPKTIDAS